MKTSLKILLLLGSALNVCQVFAQKERKQFTLKECVDTAIARNLQVSQSGLELEKSNINLKQSKANRLPDLFVDLTHGLNQGRSIDPFTNAYIDQQIFYGNYSLGTNVVLFGGGQLKNLVGQNKLLYEAGKMDLQQSKDNLTLNVILAYLQILNNEEQLRQSNNQLALTRQQVKRLTDLNVAGAIIPAQLYELKGQQAADELAVIDNKNAVESAKLSLSQLMNIPYDDAISVEPIPTTDYALKNDADVNSIFNNALSQLAIIKAASFRREAAASTIKVLKGAFYPQVTFGANVYTNYSNAAQRDVFLNSSLSPSGDFVTVGGDSVPVITTRSNYSTQKIAYPDQFRNNYSTSLGVNIRIPIFNANRAKNNLALGQIEFRNTQMVEATAKLQLKQSIEQAVLNMNAAYNKYITLLRQVSDFDSAFKIAAVRYDAGVSSQVDYLIAKNNADRAAINLIMSKYDYIFRMKIVDYYQGRLVL